MRCARARSWSAPSPRTTQALVMMDERGYCSYWNPALLTMTGCTGRARSRPLHNLIHHHRPDGRPYPMAKCPNQSRPARELRRAGARRSLLRKDGTPFPVLCAASPIVKGGRPVATVVEVRDITKRKQAEEALREADRRRMRSSPSWPTSCATPSRPSGAPSRSSAGSGRRSRASRIHARSSTVRSRTWRGSSTTCSTSRASHGGSSRCSASAATSPRSCGRPQRTTGATWRRRV